MKKLKRDIVDAQSAATDARHEFSQVEAALRRQITKLPSGKQKHERIAAKLDRITLANEQERQCLQSEICTLIARVDDERSKSSNLCQAKSMLETEIEQVKVAKADAIKARDASRRELTEQRAENDRLRRQLEDSKQSRALSMQAERIIELEEALASTTKRLSDVKAQLAALQTKHASTEVNLEETESKAQKLADENNSLKTRLQTVQDELEEALTVKFTRAPSQASSRAQAQQIAELMEAQEDLTAQVDAAHKKLKEAHNLRVRLEEQIESLENKLSESQLAAKRSKADLLCARDIMADTESSIQQVASLQYELAQEQSLKKSLSESVSSLQSELAVLQHTCNTLRSDLASMEAASEHNATAAANAAVRASRLQAEHSALIEAHETLTTEVATLHARNNKLAASVAQLTHSLREQAIEATSVKTAHAHALAAITRLETILITNQAVSATELEQYEPERFQ